MNPSPPVENPKVSVLMSCYNASPWLHDAIRSVLAQTFDDFEFIIINDGSVDNTWDIIVQYAAVDNRIVAISKENTGLADSLNLGIAKARGVWIARLDADDLCEPTRLEEQLNFLSKNPDIILLGSGCIEIDENDRHIKKHLYPSSHSGLVRHLERFKRFFPHSSAVYRTDVVRKIGGYNLRIRRSQDRRLWLELSLRGRIACLPKTLVRLRKHSGQISLDDNGRRQLCDSTAATVCHFLRKAGYKDPSVDASQDEWSLFLNWIENRLEELGTFIRHKAWTDARAEFYSNRVLLTRIFRASTHILGSRYLSTSIKQRIYGLDLARQLAYKWTNRA